MKFNRHSDVPAGSHAVLGASNYHWLRYDDEKFDRVYKTRMASRLGTELHEFAKEAIRLKIKQRRSSQTLPMYVNDAIGFRMQPEVLLYYSINSFGTADAISFRDNLLRIHDLKTGVHPGSMWQLKIYAALFCLEYGYKPHEIEIELRIYQNDDVEILRPDPDEIAGIMATTVARDRRIYELELEEQV